MRIKEIVKIIGAPMSTIAVGAGSLMFHPFHGVEHTLCWGGALLVAMGGSIWAGIRINRRSEKELQEFLNQVTAERTRILQNTKSEWSQDKKQALANYRQSIMDSLKRIK